MAHNWLITICQNNKWILFQIITVSIFTNILSLSTSLYILVVYDKVIPNNAASTLAALTIGVLVVVISDLFLKIFRGLLLNKFSENFDSSIVDKSLSALMADRRLAGHKDKDIKFILKSMDVLREFFSSHTIFIFADLPFGLLFLLVIFVISGPLAWVPSGCLVVVFLSTLVSALANRSFFAGYYESTLNSQQSDAELALSLDQIRSVGSAERFAERWKDRRLAVAKASKKLNIVSVISISTGSSIQQISLVGVVFFGAFLVFEGQLTIGSLVATVILSSRAIAPFIQVALIATKFGEVRFCMNALKNYFADTAIENKKAADRSKTWFQNAAALGSINLKDVLYKYPNSNVLSLKNVSLSVQPQELIGIIGPNGSGKSTLLKVIAGAFEATQGIVEVNGQTEPSVKKSIGVQFQNPSLLEGTILENYKIFCGEAEAAGVELALKVAGLNSAASDKAGRSPLDANSDVKSLSVGAKQLVAVGSAFAPDPSIVLLDEPSATLDHTAQIKLLERIKVAIPGKTLIIVTHSNNDLALVDRLIVLESGQIIMDGKKDAVLTRLKTKQSGASR